MTQKAGPKQSLLERYMRHRTMRGLLLSVLAITLVPVFLVSFMQAYARLVQDRAKVQGDIFTATALSQEQALHAIDTAKLALEQVAMRPEVREATVTCAQTLAIAQLGMPNVTNMARIDASGVVTCSTRPLLLDSDMSGRTWWQNLSPSQEITFFGPVVERVSQKQLLIMGHALPAVDNVANGHIVLSIDLERLERSLQARKLKSAGRLTLVDERGVAIGAAGKTASAQNVPIKVTALVTDKITAARDEQSRLWSYASAAIVLGKINIVYAMPDDVSFSSTFRHVATDIALPLMALVLAGAGLWFSIQRWVIFPILKLRLMAKNYAAGHLDTTPPDLLNGPLEMIELRDDMANMAARIGHRDELLETSVAQKDELVKELHHRVKNNLQIVISLIALQSRQLTTPQEKAPLERVHNRIAAMALVQRLIVETDTAATIDVHMLMDGLCTQIRRTYPKESLRVQLRIESAHTQIPCDVATPLALFMFEATTNAFRHGFPGAARGIITAHFSLNELGTAVLDITDTGVGWTSLNETTGTGHKLLQAFTRQLGGKMTLSSHAVEGSRVSVTFLVRVSQGTMPNPR